MLCLYIKKEKNPNLFNFLASSSRTHFQFWVLQLEEISSTGRIIIYLISSSWTEGRLEEERLVFYFYYYLSYLVLIISKFYLPRVVFTIGTMQSIDDGRMAGFHKRKGQNVFPFVRFLIFSENGKRRLNY